ncbi:MAG: hypothetical protein J6U10_09110 [Lachnospiraceae bacterium]|nr:hypothetical protein [Lachnospiraceae bacterium]MBP5184895.1 hypothetical protein [Lachnospiraceae bacterium]
MTSNRDYSDIIDLERPVSKKHPPMSLEARAAQFAPFAALTGLDEMMDETAENERDRVANELMHEKYEDG